MFALISMGLILVATTVQAVQPLGPPKAMNISSIAPRLAFEVEEEETGTCTGFFISPKKSLRGRHCTEAGVDQRPIFVTAAHCRFNAELKAFHDQFDLPAFKGKIKLDRSFANACHDMLALRVGSKVKKVHQHRIANRLPLVGEKLVAYGFPGAVVGDAKDIGLKLECEYEGVTKSDATSAWQAHMFQHQVVCNYPFHPMLPSSSMAGMSGGPMINGNNEVVGVISQQRYHCPEYAKDGCRRVRLMFTELTTEQINCHGQLTPQRSLSQYRYESYLPWAGKEPVKEVTANFDQHGCVQQIMRSSTSPSYHGAKSKADFSSVVPRL